MVEHVISYDLARGLHIIAVMAWIAALLIMPRYFVQITASQPGGELETAMIRAAAKLRSIILIPSFILTWAFGIFLFATYLVADWSQPLGEIVTNVPTWFWVKLLFVVGLSGYNGFLSVEYRKLAKGERRHSEKFWRLMGEVPFIVAIVVVLLATTEPWRR